MYDSVGPEGRALLCLFLGPARCPPWAQQRRGDQLR